jgi:hypothetical protein
MLLKLSDKISECLARAADAVERARDATDPSQKAHWLDLESQWLRLLETCRFVEQASRFLEDGHVTRKQSRERLSQTGTLIVTCPTTGKDFATGVLTDEANLSLMPLELTRSHCPHCGAWHSWWTKDAKLAPALPQSEWVEFAHAESANRASMNGRPVSLSDLLHVLVRTAVANTGGEARAAFYIANGDKLHHVIGMPEAYARQVDGFQIGPESLACGLAAARGEPIITRDVVDEPLWQPWLWLAKQFDYRACWSFPVETSTGKIVGTFAMYYKEPREAEPRDLDLAATITRAAAIMISPP